MKKFLAILLAISMLFVLAGCGDKNEPGTTPPGDAPGDTMALDEVMESILTDVADLPMCAETVLDENNFQAFAFIEPIEGAEGLASEAAINAIAHSVVLLRLPEGSDVEATAQAVNDNANANKWICVRAEKVVVAYHGQTILLVMSSSSTADAISANFDALWE